MAEAVVFSVTEQIRKKLVSLVAEEVSLAWGLKGDLKKLSKKITMIQAVLHDAEKRQVREESVRLWLKNLKDVAYDAEDVVDEFAYEILRRKLEKQNRMRMSEVRNFFSNSNPIAFRFKMANRVKNIYLMLAQIAKEADEFKLETVESTDVTTNCREIRQTHPHLDDSKVVGRNDDIKKIVDMLLNSDYDEDLSIVAIVGMAGLGKTTLAQLVYKNEIVMRHFSERMWVCVFDEFDVGKILKEMVESLTRDSCDISNIGAMIEKLKEKLYQKKFLIVFDSVWDTNTQKWECLRNSLPGIGASRGSKIIVTTRSDEVVSTMQTIITYRLMGLSDDDSWILFKQRAFFTGGAKETLNLVDIGRKIVKRCRGLPLTITTLGALMHSKKEEHKWLSIQNSEIWNLPKGEKEILPVLRLSFDNLPSPYLKQCFAYCSFFPKGFQIEKEELIQLWMAQGFLQPSQGRNCEMENIGDEYFKALLWNSLVLQDLEVDNWDKEKTKCRMHDLVHDLAIFVSGSQCLTLGSGEVNDNVEGELLWLCPNGDSTIPKESARKKLTLLLNNYVLSDLSLNLKCLRVLIFYGTNIKKLPTSIDKLKHLRYLDISYTAIQEFPESLDKLYNLQTLRLMKCSIELPKNLKYLINLRHIYFDDLIRPLRMPVEVGRLTCLQTLPLFLVGQERGRQIKELGCLNKLRGELKICYLEHVKDIEEAKRANLLEKTNLYELGYVWNTRRESDNNDEDVLEGLQPPENLKRLLIENFGGNEFPSWMMRMGGNSREGLLLHNNLVEVRLKDCYKCEKLPTLGQLPLLRFLVIHGMGNMKCIGPEFYRYNDDRGSGNSDDGAGTGALFPALKILMLIDLCNLVEWMEARAIPTAGVFPCLEQLELRNCPKLMSAPSHFPSLRELRINDNHNSMPLANISTNLTTLTLLWIKSLSDLTSLPEGLFQNNKNLASLRILQCEKLRYLPEGLHTLVSLEELDIEYCPHLESIPSILGLTSLRKLDIGGCERLTSPPSGLRSCTFLESLIVVRCPNIQISVVESDLRELRSLSTLAINCGKLKHCPEGLVCLTHLKFLGIGGFWEELDSFPNIEDILKLQQLQALRLWGWPKLKSLPDQLQHLTTLSALTIENFDGVEVLPEWLGNLSSLERLNIWKCKNLMYLPSLEAMQRLTKLWVLEIEDCPLLRERCAKGSGLEWFKISHIRRIDIDSEVISSDDQHQAARRFLLQ